MKNQTSISQKNQSQDMMGLRKRIRVYNIISSVLSIIVIIGVISARVWSTQISDNPIKGQDLRFIGPVALFYMSGLVAGLSNILFFICLLIAKIKLTNYSVTERTIMAPVLFIVACIPYLIGFPSFPFQLITFWIVVLISVALLVIIYWINKH